MQDQEAIDVLVKNNIRITQQRKLVLNYLINSHEHPDVKTIYRDLNQQDSNLSLATIYNTLNNLVKHNIIIEIDNNDGNTHYDCFDRPHIHVICKNCGKITDVFTDNLNQIEQDAINQSDYSIDTDNIELYGLCPECKKAENN